jgi:hypothetical protein
VLHAPALMLGCTLALTSQLDDTVPPPEALLRFERARAALQTGVVECSRETRGVDTAGGRGEFRLFTYATARFGLQDAIWVHRGDADGVTLRDEAGNPSATSPLARLRAGGRVWEDERGAGMRVSCFTPGAGRVPDARTFGVSAAVSQLDLAEALWKDADAGGRTYREALRDGLHIVTAEETAKRSSGGSTRRAAGTPCAS